MNFRMFLRTECEVIYSCIKRAELLKELLNEDEKLIIVTLR